MTISVAMATYNGEKFIRKQLDSIIQQTLVPDEIVVCDDCSKDKTLEIVYHYADVNDGIKWVILRNEKNLGYIKNFFNAIRHTTGDIIVLSDQDDIWDKNKIKLFNEWFLNNKDLLSLHTDYSIIDQNDNVISERVIRYRQELEKYSLEKFSKRLNYSGMSSAFRATLKNELLKLDPNTIPTHDWVIHALALVRNGMYVSSVITSYRRYTGNNVALRINKKVQRNGIEQRIEVVNGYLKYYELLVDFAGQRSAMLAINYFTNLIQIQDRRVVYLKNKSIIGWLRSFFYIDKYPSKKAYFCDLLYILEIF